MTLTRRIAHLETRRRLDPEKGPGDARRELAERLETLHQRLLLSDPEARRLACETLATLSSTDTPYHEATAALKARIAELVP